LGSDRDSPTKHALLTAGRLVFRLYEPYVLLRRFPDIVFKLSKY